MRKNIIIKENGVSKNLSVDVLRLAVNGGGTEDWVPTDGKNLVNIKVLQNGTYKASDFSAYGISEVEVACTINGGSATSSATSKSPNAQSNPSINEGGKARILSAKRLKTDLQGGGSCLWIQEDAVSLNTKSITEDNKVYKADDDGCYGYSEVVVSGISISKEMDEDGDEVIEHTDGGGTEDTKIPSRIELVPPPTFTGPYNDGEDISFAGMVVKAYLSSGQLWTDASHPNGIIPFSELILPVTQADGSEASEQLYTDGAGLNALMIYYVPTWGRRYWEKGIPGHPKGSTDEVQVFTHTSPLGENNGKPATYCGAGPATLLVTRYNNANYMAALTGDLPVNYNMSEYRAGELRAQARYTGWFFTGGSSGGITKLNEFQNASFSNKLTNIPESTVDPSRADISALQGSTKGQNVPVQWIRPGDYSTLETSFVITVN